MWLVRMCVCVIFDFFGIGMMLDDFRQAGMEAYTRDRLNIVVKTRESWSAQAFSTLPGTPS